MAYVPRPMDAISRQDTRVPGATWMCLEAIASRCAVAEALALMREQPPRGRGVPDRDCPSFLSTSGTVVAYL